MQSLTYKLSGLLSHIWDNRPSDKFVVKVGAFGNAYLFEVRGKVLFLSYENDIPATEMVLLLVEEIPPGECNSRTPLIRKWYPIEYGKGDHILTAVYLDGDAPAHYSPLTLRRLCSEAEEVLKEISSYSKGEPLIFTSA